ncbi:hypothetical protein BG842_03710 [Haladaptatus sp. W1]|uniref:hypothetical protein n=1 Tax=Haladaptatus sp. W1 TaxID=1897478 RepID=UPI000849A11D|nr:hypothetical protein [Haladaptatus sp. W1]ODR80634.1 hypothetical protein BG842_03710 [Haladaptatus sp. W1]
MTDRTTPERTTLERHDSAEECDVDDGSSCRTSPVEEYVWLVKRVGRKIRDVVGSASRTND